MHDFTGESDCRLQLELSTASSGLESSLNTASLDQASEKSSTEVVADTTVDITARVGTESETDTNDVIENDTCDTDSSTDQNQKPNTSLFELDPELDQYLSSFQVSLTIRSLQIKGRDSFS